jgi:hypothetical protein
MLIDNWLDRGDASLGNSSGGSGEITMTILYLKLFAAKLV